MCWKSRCFALMTTLGLLLPGAARASLLQKPLSLPELTAQSDGIFIGRVVSSMGTRASDRSEIFTVVTLRVESTIKGQHDRDGYVRLQLPGGEVEDQLEVVRGAASFKLGEEAMVFVSHNATGAYEVVGMAQGKFSVKEEAGSDLLFAVSDPEGMFIMVQDADSHALASIPAPRQQRPLADLIHEVKALVTPALASR